LGENFNLDVHSDARMLSKAGPKNAQCEPDEVATSFRKEISGMIQGNSIDHFAWTGPLLAGSQVTKDGRFVTDHITIIGWINAEMECDK
jgi:hypothetical protein